MNFGSALWAAASAFALESPPEPSGTEPQFQTPRWILVAKGEVVTINGIAKTSAAACHWELRKGAVVLGKGGVVGSAPSFAGVSVALPPATMSSAGIYLLHAGSVTGVGQSAPISLSVVDTAPQVTSSLVARAVVLTAPVAGEGLSYAWTKDGGSLSDSARLTGSATKALRIVSASLADEGRYVCSVSSPAGVLKTTQDLIIASVVPTVTTTALTGTGVAKAYSFRLAADKGQSFYAAGLPPGLVCEASTGIISGRARAPGAFKVTVRSVNAKGASAAKVLTLQVDPLPQWATGAFMFMAGSFRTGEQNSRCNATISAAGTVTAKLQMSELTGWLREVSVTATIMHELGFYGGDTYRALFPPAAPFYADPNRPLSLLIKGENSVALVQRPHPDFGGEDTPILDGWPLRYTTPTPAQQADRATFFGYHTLTIDPGRGIGGKGIGSFTVAATGLLTLSGKLPDGTALTIGGHAAAPTSAWLYGNRGCLSLNWWNPDPGAGGRWTRPATFTHNPSGSDLGVPFAANIEAQALTTKVARYFPPRTPQNPTPMLMGREAPTRNEFGLYPSNASIRVSGGDARGRNDPEFWEAFLWSNHQLTIPSTSLPEWPKTERLQFNTFVFNPITGYFSGSAMQATTDPVTARPVSLPIAFQGVIVQDSFAIMSMAEGFFVRPVAVYDVMQFPPMLIGRSTVSGLITVN